MSDIELVREHFPCAGTGCRKYEHDAYCPASQRRKGSALARAVAERVKAEMREELDRRAQMAHDLLIALAKRRLVDANNECEVGAWPNGQEWDELSQSSRDVFKHEAREEAGVDHAAYIKPLREGTIHVVEHD